MTRLIPLLGVLAGLLLLAPPAWAQPDFERAAEALRQGNDGEALAVCQRLEKSGQASFGSLYNQGLALRNLGDLPRARGSFERALLLEPHSLATRRRLRETIGRLPKEVAALDVRGTPWWKAHQAEVLLILPGLLLLLLVGWSRVKERRPAATPLLAICLSGLGVLALIGLTAPAKKRAVLVDQKARLLPSPQPDSAGQALPGGVMVEVIERSDHYLKVRLGDGRSGWLRAAQTVQLSLPDKQKMP